MFPRLSEERSKLILPSFVLSGMLYGFLWVMSTGKVSSSSATIGGVKVNGMSRTFEWKEEEIYYMLYWIFGIFWVSEIFTALGQFVLSYSVTLWWEVRPPAPSSCYGRRVGGLFKCQSCLCMHCISLLCERSVWDFIAFMKGRNQVG